MISRSKDKLFFKIMIDVSQIIIESASLFNQSIDLKNERSEYAKKIKDLEDKGDNYAHMMYGELNKTFFTPLDHEDLLELTGKLDDIIDGIESCSARLVYLHIEETDDYMKKFAEIFVSCADHLHTAIVSLSKKDYTSITTSVIEINILENEGDRLMREGISSLFTQDIDTLRLMKMKEIYEQLEKTTDSFENLMDVMKSLVMKYA